MQGSGVQHVCFYSNNCRWSEGFLKELARTPYKNEFKFICVDPSPNRPQLPGWLKKVPTIVIRGEKEPRTDGEVMNWLAERKLRDSTGPGGGNGASEPEPWIANEMGGSFTKSFSYFNEEGKAPPGNFEYLQGASAVGVRTASDMPGGGLGARAQNKSKKEELFDKQMEQYMRAWSAAAPAPVMRQ